MPATGTAREYIVPGTVIAMAPDTVPDIVVTTLIVVVAAAAVVVFWFAIFILVVVVTAWLRRLLFGSEFLDQSRQGWLTFLE